MGRQVEYRRKLTPVLGITYPTLQYVYRVVTRCWKDVIKHILKPFISSVRSHEPPYRADANVDSTDATARRCCGVGVRVSATVRRGAAPYADGAQRLVEARMHDCLLLLVGQRLGPGGIYVEFCVRHNGTIPPAPPTCSSPFLRTPSI